MSSAPFIPLLVGFWLPLLSRPVARHRLVLPNRRPHTLPSPAMCRLDKESRELGDRKDRFPSVVRIPPLRDALTGASISAWLLAPAKVSMPIDGMTVLKDVKPEPLPKLARYFLTTAPAGNSRQQPYTDSPLSTPNRSSAISLRADRISEPTLSGELSLTWNDDSPRRSLGTTFTFSELDCRSQLTRYGQRQSPYLMASLKAFA